MCKKNEAVSQGYFVVMLALKILTQVMYAAVFRASQA